MLKDDFTVADLKTTSTFDLLAQAGMQERQGMAVRLKDDKGLLIAAVSPQLVGRILTALAVAQIFITDDVPKPLDG